MSGVQNQDQDLIPLRLRSRVIRRGTSRRPQRRDNIESPVPLRVRRGRRRNDSPQCGRLEENRQRSRSPRSPVVPSRPSGVGNDGRNSWPTVHEASRTTTRPSGVGNDRCNSRPTVHEASRTTAGPSGVGNDRRTSGPTVHEASRTMTRPSEGNVSIPVPGAPETRSGDQVPDRQTTSRVAKRKQRIEGLPSRSFTKDDELTSCPICMEQYVNGEQVISLPCNHIYHRDCLSLWLRSSPRCPLCRCHCFDCHDRKRTSSGLDCNNSVYHEIIESRKVRP